MCVYEREREAGDRLCDSEKRKRERTRKKEAIFDVITEMFWTQKRSKMGRNFWRGNIQQNLLLKHRDTMTFDRENTPLQSV